MTKINCTRPPRLGLNPPAYAWSGLSGLLLACAMVTWLIWLTLR